MIENIKWFGHASFKIAVEVIIYIDPWKIKGTKGPDADIILITHPHYDHCSDEDTKLIRREDTTIVAPADCNKELPAKIDAIKPGDKVTIKGVTIEAHPAYNVGKGFHPKASGWVGFIITTGAGQRIYHAGDTDLIPEMDEITANIALLPIGGTYTMDAKDAAEAANKINPEVAIPMHYGSIVGSANDAQRFKELCKCKVEILAST